MSSRKPFRIKRRNKVRLASNINRLGREGSNLRMAESKSARLFNDFKAHLEETFKRRFSNINSLAVIPKYRSTPQSEDRIESPSEIRSSRLSGQPFTIDTLEAALTCPPSEQTQAKLPEIAKKPAR